MNDYKEYFELILKKERFEKKSEMLPEAKYMTSCKRIFLCRLFANCLHPKAKHPFYDGLSGLHGKMNIEGYSKSSLRNDISFLINLGLFHRCGKDRSKGKRCWTLGTKEGCTRIFNGRNCSGDKVDLKKPSGEYHLCKVHKPQLPIGTYKEFKEEIKGYLNQNEISFEERYSEVLLLVGAEYMSVKDDYQNVDNRIKKHGLSKKILSDSYIYAYAYHVIIPKIKGLKNIETKELYPTNMVDWVNKALQDKEKKKQNLKPRQSLSEMIEEGEKSFTTKITN